MKINMKKSTMIYETVIVTLLIAGIVYFKPSVFLFIPLLVSVIIMFLQSNVNRYAFLIGAANSILYAVSYVKMSLYATALYAIVVSFPLQLMTFFNWNRYTEKNKTKLKEMSAVARLKLFCGMAGGFVLLYVIFSSLNSEYWIFDNCISILGIVASVLCLMRFKEYLFLQMLCNAISFYTFVIMTGSQQERIIWVINAANSVISSCLALKKINNKERGYI